MSSKPAAKGDSELLTEIPDELKKLAKYVMRGFYPLEYVLLVDLLVRNVIMKDDDLEELLKFDKKQLRIMLNKLKSDKLLRSTLRVETQADGKTNRQNYYFINYKVFVNVVKYKLDKMRQKIESRERESTCKALYKCANCDKQYNEYDTGDLMDFMTGEMKCTLCGAEVEEDETTAPEKDTYMQIALFNEQMRPLFDLLKDVEHIKLSPEVLEPTPAIASQSARAQHLAGSRGHAGWSLNSRPNYDLNHMVTINMGDDSREKPEQKEIKEAPQWMKESTVDGAVTEADSTAAAAESKLAAAAGTSKNRRQDQGEIMRALLVHERKSGGRSNAPSAALSDNESDESASDDDNGGFPGGLYGLQGVSKRVEAEEEQQEQQEFEDEDDEEEEEVMVSVRGRTIPFSEVTEQRVAEMTLEEKEVYIKLAQEAYAAMHD